MIDERTPANGTKLSWDEAMKAWTWTSSNTGVEAGEILYANDEGTLGKAKLTTLPSLSHTFDGPITVDLGPVPEELSGIYAGSHEDVVKGERPKKNASNESGGSPQKVHEGNLLCVHDQPLDQECDYCSGKALENSVELRPGAIRIGKDGAFEFAVEGNGPDLQSPEKTAQEQRDLEAVFGREACPWTQEGKAAEEARSGPPMENVHWRRTYFCQEPETPEDKARKQREHDEAIIRARPEEEPVAEQTPSAYHLRRQNERHARYMERAEALRRKYPPAVRWGRVALALIAAWALFVFGTRWALLSPRREKPVTVETVKYGGGR